MSRADFERSYQKAPIIFTGGIAAQIPGGMLPITSIIQAGDYSGVGSQQNNAATSPFDFYLLPGAGLIANDASLYPFANQTVAGNAIITQPLRLTLSMIAPANKPGAWSQKSALFTALKKSIDQHIAQGGVFTVATPAYIYTNCLLMALRDMSEGDPKRVQERWEWDFMQPLLTLEAAQQAQNSLMQKITNGVQVTPNDRGQVTATGQEATVGNPASGAAPSKIPAGQSLKGTSASTPAPARPVPSHPLAL